MTMFTTRSIPVLFSLFLTTSPLYAAPVGHRHVIINEARLHALSEDDQRSVLELRDKLDAVLATDRSTLDRSERQALRQEYRALKQEMDRYNTGGTVIYLSTAGVIIILLLLIILL